MRKVLIGCLIAAMSSPSYISGQTTDTHEKLSTTLSRMASNEWATRMEAFEETVNIVFSRSGVVGQPARVSGYAEAFQRFFSGNPEESDRLQVSLINLLQRENEVERHAAESNVSLSEGYLNYYGDLIGAVAALNDERAVPALLGAIRTGGMATRGLAALGPKALGPVLDQLKDDNPTVRSSALRVVRKMFELHKLDDSNIDARRALHGMLEDPDHSVRAAAVSAVGELQNKQEFIPALKRLAKEDPAKSSGNAGGEAVYPVRREAQKVLKKAENQ